ncbi:ABC transporter ATP-binding protein [Rathayibacter sp. CAU 1779]
MNAPIVELRDVHVTYKTRTGGTIFKRGTVDAVRGVDLDIAVGRTVGIVGESGCGKSTLAKVIVGLQPPTSGQVLFRGKPVNSRASRTAFGRSVSVVFQDPATALNPRMTVLNALLDPMQVHGIGNRRSREVRAYELLDVVGLPSSAAGVVPAQISGGQRQRVAIARALALDPQVMVADEPTSALDVSVRAQILNLLGTLKRELGLGMVFISHDIQTVRHVSDTICVMHDGVIVERGDAEQIFDHPTHPYTQKLLGAAPSLLHA